MSDEPAKPAEPSGGGSKPPKIILALLVLNLGASGFTTFKVVTTPAAEAASHEKVEPAADVVGPIVALEPFVVNLDETGQSRYLKVTLQLEIEKQEYDQQLTNAKQLLRDVILSHLSGLHLADTLGATAKDKLRTELLEKIEKLIGAHKVKRIFFSEFVVQ
jgi:flagellar protein FliL